MLVTRAFQLLRQPLLAVSTRNTRCLSFLVSPVSVARGPQNLRKPLYSPEIWTAYKKDLLQNPELPVRKVPVQRIDGTETGESVVLFDNVFGVGLRKDILARVVKFQRNSIRQGTASAKTRSEVSGSGRKLWKQKGTGRARLGSIRAPQTRHGGFAHPPKPRDWSTKLQKKVRALGLKIALSARLSENRLHVVDTPTMTIPKTKDVFSQIKQNWGLPKALIVIGSDVSENFLKSVENIPDIDVLAVAHSNVYDILNHPHVLLTKDAVDFLHYRFIVPDFVETDLDSPFPALPQLSK